MITENDPTLYVVKINGVDISPRYPTPQLAESFVFRLPMEQQAVAQIVPVTNTGTQVLFG